MLFFFEAKDANPIIREGAMMWNGDSVQFRINQTGIPSESGQNTDYEFGLAVDADSKVKTFNWNSMSELPADLSEVTGKRTATGYFVAAQLDWKLLNAIRFPEQRHIMFSYIFNTSDSPGDRNVYFLTKGLHDDKSSLAYFHGMLFDPIQGSAGIQNIKSISAKAFSADLILTGYSNETKLGACLTDSTGKQRVMPLGYVESANPGDIYLLNSQLPIRDLAEGDITVEFFAANKSIGKFIGSKSDPGKEQALRLGKVFARYSKAKEEIAKLGEEKSSAYFTLPLAVLDDMLPRFQEWLSSAAGNEDALIGLAERFEMVLPSVDDSLTDLENRIAATKTGQKQPESWIYAGGAVKLQDGWPYAHLKNSSGESAFRPVMLTGYGHFTNMTPFMQRFPKYGVNVIQMEIGPNSFYPNEGKNQEFEPDFSSFERAILPRIEDCRRENMQFCLLISPHYSPKWWLEKHPQVKYASGFLRYDVLRPEAREMMSAHIRDLIGRLRQIPDPSIIHSICLQNEPVYFADWNNPFTREQFEQFLQKNWPGVKFDLATGISDNAVRGAWNAFRKQAMADWNGFLTEEVKKAWPEIPVHTKIMIVPSTFGDHGIDPETFAWQSDYNGNDNYCCYLESDYIADWVRTLIGSELQYSMRPISLANTENHIIRDNEKRPIPNDHIYTANMFQHLTGNSTLVTWVWALYKPEEERRVAFALRGGISLRPGNLIAHGLAQLDATRLAPEIIRFSQHQPEVALLYSPSTLNVGPVDYQQLLRPFFAETAFTGHRVRFLSERQLAAGEFDNVKLLIAIGAANVSKEAIAGMEKFRAQGGRIAADAVSLKRDPLDRAIRLPFQPETISATITASELTKNWLEPFDKFSAGLKEIKPGVFYRRTAGITPGSTLITLINFNHKPVKLTLSGAKSYRERISETEWPVEFELAPEKPLLIEAQ